jgi:hypothetical protein
MECLQIAAECTRLLSEAQSPLLELSICQVCGHGTGDSSGEDKAASIHLFVLRSSAVR